jgi:dihydrolipoyl dehydrogenase
VVVGEVAEPTDVLVLGAGPGGYTAALRAAALGKRVTVVERDAVGGVCLNVGCIPSKVMIHAADVIDEAAGSADLGLERRVDVDPLDGIHHRMREVVGGLTDGVGGLLRRAGVNVVSGAASFIRPSRVMVVDGDHVSHYEFEQAIVATGSRPIELPGLGFDGEKVLDSTQALFGLDRVPDRLVVVGGGYIGLELGTAYAKLGAEVTVVEMTDSLLPEMDPALGRIVGRGLADRKVDVRLGTRAVGLGGQGLVVRCGDGPEETIPATAIVVAVGRRPNTDGLGLDLAGLAPGDGGRLEAGPDRRVDGRILAIGDVTAGPALAHKATAEADVAAQTAAGRPARFDPAAVPAVVFTDPEVASVGLTAEQATAAGAEVRRHRLPLGGSGRARILGRPSGFVEVVADGDGTVLGVHMAGPTVSELAAEAALAVEMAATVEDLASTIHPHPTVSESVGDTARELLVGLAAISRDG